MKSLTDHLRVAALPLAITWADREANLKAVEEAMATLPDNTDIVVLPELFSTAYTDDPALMADLAEPADGPTMQTVRRLAAAHSTAIAGSFLAKGDDGKVYNRGFFVEPSGETTFYDKRHLFSLSSESRVFSAGQKPMPVIRFRGWNIAMIVCYDLRFPVWCRCRRSAYDLLLVVANWPQARAYAWEHLLIARAIENQCCVVGANRGGSDLYGNYDGLTYIFDGRGMPVGETSDKSPFVTADLSRSKQDEYRKKFPVANDADDYRLL